MIEPDLQFSILCDEVRREDNGKWLLLGLFEQISVSQFPTQHRALCVMNKWIRGEGDWTQQTRFLDDNDKVLVQSESIPFQLADLDASFMAIQTFAGLPLEHEGKIWVEIFINDELKQRYPISVNVISR
ncbi:hypothetical protein EON83_20965 [bacterium]|nr:MAG: hypothetical protein EON83_20965 [bacterium]